MPYDVGYDVLVFRVRVRVDVRMFVSLMRDEIRKFPFISPERICHIICMFHLCNSMDKWL